MKARFAVVFSVFPLALQAGGCGGAPNGGACAVDPQCYVVSPAGQCSVDPGATCFDGQWQCSERGQLGSGCYPDGGIAPPPDAGTCPLATLSPPLACTGDATCTPYSGHCAFDAFTGQGECECGPPDARCRDGRLRPRLLRRRYCGLPSFTITCTGPGDTTCDQYVATCVATGESGTLLRLRGASRRTRRTTARARTTSSEARFRVNPRSLRRETRVRRETPSAPRPRGSGSSCTRRAPPADARPRALARAPGSPGQ